MYDYLPWQTIILQFDNVDTEQTFVAGALWDIFMNIMMLNCCDAKTPSWKSKLQTLLVYLILNLIEIYIQGSIAWKLCLVSCTQPLLWGCSALVPPVLPGGNLHFDLWHHNQMHKVAFNIRERCTGFCKVKLSVPYDVNSWHGVTDFPKKVPRGRWPKRYLARLGAWQKRQYVTSRDENVLPAQCVHVFVCSCIVTEPRDAGQEVKVTL